MVLQMLKKINRKLTTMELKRERWGLKITNKV